MAGKKAHEDFQNWDMTTGNPEGSSIKSLEAQETEVF